VSDASLGFVFLIGLSVWFYFRISNLEARIEKLESEDKKRAKEIL
jgi:hypothetical protein